jgi:hypothetical protein
VCNERGDHSFRAVETPCNRSAISEAPKATNSPQQKTRYRFADFQGCEMSRPLNKPLPPTARLNFLLGASDMDLSSFELARLAEVANLRSDLHAILDKLIDEMAQAALVGWFRLTDRNALKRALENPEDVLAWAKKRIRDRQRSEDELIPRASLEPGAAHLAAALRYQERNIAKGLCSVCPQPLDRNSVRFCTRHLAIMRARKKPKGGKGEQPGTIGYLYSEGFESGHGRQPGTLASLAMSREKKTRALLAELGIPTDSAAVSLKAATEALLAWMPDSKARAMTQNELFTACKIPSRTTGQKALEVLLSEGRIQRIGKGTKGHLFRYFEKQANKKKPAKRRGASVFGVSTETLVG